MAGFSITGQMKVSTLKKEFLKEFGLTLRVYDGRTFAEPTQTISKVRIKKGSGKGLSVAKNMKVGNFEDKIQEEFGLKVQVSGSDDSYLCNNNLTLNAAQNNDKKKLDRKARKSARQGKFSDNVGIKEDKDNNIKHLEIIATNLEIKNIQLEQYGTTFGLGLPLKRLKSVLHLSVEWGERGTTQNGLLKESYWKTRFGITLNDLWFVKRKYD